MVGLWLAKAQGQLLVVVRHTDTSPSSCYEPELIPDPLGDPSPSSNRKLLVGADIFNGSGISPKEKLGKFKKSRKLRASSLTTTEG